jgi:hypothetical protein
MEFVIKLDGLVSAELWSRKKLTAIGVPDALI